MFKKLSFYILLKVLAQTHPDPVILAAILFLCKLGGHKIQHTIGQC